MAHGTAHSGVIEHGCKSNPPLAKDEKMIRIREIEQVILHSTATNPSWYSDRSVEDVVKEVPRWHTEERKWSDIGYHLIIHRNGDIAEGRPIDRAGAHCRGANKHSVGIASVGGRAIVINLGLKIIEGIKWFVPRRLSSKHFPDP